jgi:hypothetical protein
MQLGNTPIQFEQEEKRLKVEWPVKRNVIAIVIYTVLAVVWFGGLIVFINSLFNPPNPRGIDALPTSISVAWVIGVLLWLYIWIRHIGRLVLRWWQFYLANREILFIDDETLIIRRPVSLLGLTDAYDRRHTSHFSLNEQYEMVGFQYGNVRRVLFGQTLSNAERESLVRFLNNRFFPHVDDDDDDDD